MDAPQVRRAPRAAALAEGASQGARGAARAGADRHRRADAHAARARRASSSRARSSGCGARSPRPEARDADAAPAAGRRRVGQDDRRRARGAAGDRERPAGRVHGAHRNPRRAALSQARVVARRARREDRVAVGFVAREGARSRRSRRWQAAKRRSRSGTHALFQEGVEMPQLGLAIVDEQHRFGVAQRLALRGKGIAEAHQLMMSATPIPRTLAMTFYADLDVSVLDEMPPGRTPVAHAARQREAARRDRALGGQADRGEAPGLLGVSADRGVREARAADGGGAACRADGCVSGSMRVGLVHGGLKPDEKAETMDAFAARRDRRARRDDGDRSRRRRAERVGDGDRARGALRPRATAPAARTRRPRRRGEHLRAAVRGAADRHGESAPACRLREQRRLRDRAPGPDHSRPRRVSRRSPVGDAVAAFRRPRAGRGADRAGARCSRRSAATRSGGGAAPPRSAGSAAREAFISA